MHLVVLMLSVEFFVPLLLKILVFADILMEFVQHLPVCTLSSSLAFFIHHFWSFKLSLFALIPMELGQKFHICYSFA